MFYCFIESAQVLCFMTGFWNTQNPALAVCFHVLVSILEFVHLLELKTKVCEFFTITKNLPASASQFHLYLLCIK